MKATIQFSARHPKSFFMGSQKMKTAGIFINFIVILIFNVEIVIECILQRPNILKIFL